MSTAQHLHSGSRGSISIYLRVSKDTLDNVSFGECFQYRAAIRPRKLTISIRVSPRLATQTRIVSWATSSEHPPRVQECAQETTSAGHTLQRHPREPVPGMSWVSCSDIADTRFSDILTRSAQGIKKKHHKTYDRHTRLHLWVLSVLDSILAPWNARNPTCPSGRHYLYVTPRR